MKILLRLQLVIATLLSIAGVALLFQGFWVAPVGEIHNSVLIGYGEVMTFDDGLLGVDYSYRFKKFKYTKKKENDDL